MNRPGINIEFLRPINSFRRLRLNVSSKRLARIVIEVRSHNLVSKASGLSHSYFFLSLRIFLPFCNTPRSAGEI